MKNLFYVLITLLIVSCSENKTAHIAMPVTETQTVVQNVVEIAKVKKAGPYSNPNIIYGSNFGTFFQAMYRTMEFEQMLKFTSKESIKKHGEAKIFNFYQTINFGYHIKLKSSKNIGDSTYVLRFEVNSFATRQYRSMKVIVENDSCKVVLPDNLSKFMTGKEILIKKR